MITVRKLSSLSEPTRLRKSARVLASVIRDPRKVSRRYRRELLQLIASEKALPEGLRAHAAELATHDLSQDLHPHLLSGLLSHLEAVLGLEPAEWDLVDVGTPSEIGDAATMGRQPVAVSLFVEHIRSPFNLGSIVRTAAAFGIRDIAVGDGVAAHRHPRFRRSAMGADTFCRLVEGVSLPESRPGRPLVALETGGTPVSRFAFPASGVLLIGSEELGLSPQALAAADHRITVPMAGPKASLNVGVAVGIVLSWWTAQMSGVSPE